MLLFSQTSYTMPMNLRTVVLHILILFLSVLTGISAVAAQQDSLLSALKKTENASERIHLLQELCLIIPGSDSVQLNTICRELTELAGKSSEPIVQAEGYRVAGNSYGTRSEFSKAFVWLNKAISISSGIKSAEGQSILAKACLNLGTIYHQNGDFEEALINYLKAENIFFAQNDYAWLIRVYASLGDLSDKLNDPEKRKQYNEKAFDLVMKTTDLTAWIKAYTAKANNLANENKFDEALKYYQKTIELSSTLKNKHLEHTAYYNLGFTYSRMDDYGKALEMYTKSYEVAESNNDKPDMGDALYKMGLMQLYSGNLAKSRQSCNEALKIAGEINSNILRRNIYDVLYSVEESAGDYKKANEYLNKYIDMIYEIFSQEDQLQVNFLNAKFETEKRNNKISKLETEKQIQRLNIRKQQIFIWALAIVILLSILLILLLFRNNKVKQKLALKQVELQEQKIQELEKERQLVATKSVLQGEESERSRMARDLHDGLGGLLSGVKLNLSSMKGNSILTSENAETFDHAIRLLDTSISELRRVAHNLMPETLNRYGLKTALNDFVNELSSDGPPVLSFRFFGNDFRYTTHLELTVYRITQELVNNAMKHSEARNIDIQLIAEQERVCVQVVDNGKGFDTQACQGFGKGLVSIRDRVAANNGRFDIESILNEGTEATIEFLLP